MKDFDFGLDVFVDKFKDGIEMKNRHLSEVIDRLEEFKLKQKNEINKQDISREHKLYLTGVVDGMDYVIGKLKKYNDGMKK